MDEGQSDIGRAVDWMIQRINTQGRLSQPEAVSTIGRLFGPECLGRNAADNIVLARPLTELFRRRTTRTVEWDPGALCWYARTAPGGRPASAAFGALHREERRAGSR